jgi:superfamily II DNA/RNA helicase
VILILAPTRQLAEHIARELRDRDKWPRFVYNQTHRWLDPRDVRTTLHGQPQRFELVVATTARAPHTLGTGWRARAWQDALQYVHDNKINYTFYHCP